MSFLVDLRGTRGRRSDTSTNLRRRQTIGAQDLSLRADLPASAQLLSPALIAES
jgi:hypothetical protein